ncbi:GTPase [Rhizobium sp. AAP43]|uniref:GTPase n=1 Tax=Rhizobium sp. AAP43 TaxID=1523420 RepID=UPI0006B912EA|nr:GTPase [Rhizobium sp. AAP43]KPF42045.1 GTPase [Rhizobium sp. AAP43]
MNMPLTRYLKDFSAPPEPPAPVPSVFDLSIDEGMDLDFPALPEPEPVDVEAIRREAYAEGHEAGRIEATQAFEVDRQALEIGNAQTLAEHDRRLREEFSTTLGEQLPHLIRQMSLAISEQVARALVPLFSEAVAAKAVEELAHQLEAAILAGEAGTIRVKGPRGLFDQLLAAMPEHAALLRHVEGDDLDLSAEFGDAALVTRISAFAASLKKVME